MRHGHPNPIDIYFGSRVRALRTMMDVSQEKLGGHLGITFQQIQKYESGKNRISAGRLQEAARLLGVPVAYFFEGAPGGSPAPVGDADHTSSTIGAFLSTTEGIQLNKAFGRIEDVRLWRRLVDFVRAIADDGAAPH